MDLAVPPAFMVTTSRHSAYITTPLRIFVGFDPRETVAFHVLNHSIQRRSSVPVAVVPVALSQLADVMQRPRDPMQSNDFAFSRWLVPWLTHYAGWAVFMDCDMLVRTDILELFHHADPRYAVQVVKHDHKPKETVKYLGNPQTRYERKNWSSVMLMNCGHPAMRALSPGYVNTAPGLELHQFRWLEDDLIGELPHDWNVLVDYDDPVAYPNPKNLHYTTGGPWFREYQQCDWAEDWFAERDDMLFCEQLADA